MVDVSTGLSAQETLTQLAEQGVDPRDPAFQDALLALAQEAVAEQKSERQKALATIATACDAVAVAGVPWVSKSSGNPGFHLRWTSLPDGRRVEIRVLSAKPADSE